MRTHWTGERRPYGAQRAKVTQKLILVTNRQGTMFIKQGALLNKQGAMFNKQGTMFNKHGHLELL